MLVLVGVRVRVRFRVSVSFRVMGTMVQMYAGMIACQRESVCT